MTRHARRRRHLSLAAVALGGALLLGLSAHAADGAPSATTPGDAGLRAPTPAAPKPVMTRKLIVGTKPTPPFVIKEADGRWRGISIELWEAMAKELGLTFEYRERDLQGLLAGLEDGSLDVVAAALTVTSVRESSMDFCHPFYTTGLGIAVASDGSSSMPAAVRNLFSWGFLRVVLGLTLLLFVVGFLMWLFERKRNAEQFGGLKGIGEGFWWSAVTMTTVGYGDRAPKTWLGRAVAIIWMFAAIIFISGFTAALSSSLTVSQLGTTIHGPKDLVRVRVGALARSAAESYLGKRNIRTKAFASPEAGLEAVTKRKLEAFVHDAPILRYLVAEQALPLMVLPQTFDRQDYAFAVPTGSPLREHLNRVLIPRLREDDWHRTLERYLGK